MANIVLRPLESIFATQAASFEARGPLDEAIARLSAATKSSAWTAWLEASPECLMGKVSRGDVFVWWYRGPRSPLPAVFRGAFSLDGDRVVLAGHFQYSARDRLLLGGAVAMLLLFLVSSVAGLASVLVATSPITDRILASIFLGALMATTALVFRSVQPLRQDDIVKVSRTIRSAMTGEPSNDALQRPGVSPAR
jgi:hypothetical protein